MTMRVGIGDRDSGRRCRGNRRRKECALRCLRSPVRPRSGSACTNPVAGGADAHASSLEIAVEGHRPGQPHGRRLFAAIRRGEGDGLCAGHCCCQKTRAHTRSGGPPAGQHPGKCNPWGAGVRGHGSRFFRVPQRSAQDLGPAPRYRGVMTPPRCSAIAVAVTCAVTVGMAQERPQPTDAARVQVLRARGLALGYNLDHDAALATFRDALVIDPDDAASHRLVAATLWIKTLIAQGAVTAEDFLGQAGTSLRKPARAHELEACDRRAIDVAQERSLRSRRGKGRRGGFALRARRRIQPAGVVHRDRWRRRSEEPVGRRVMPIAITSAYWRSIPRRADAGLVVGMYPLRGVGAAALVATCRADRRDSRAGARRGCGSWSRPPRILATRRPTRASR